MTRVLKGIVSLSSIYFLQQMFLVANKGHGESSHLLSILQFLSHTCGMADSLLGWGLIGKEDK